MNEIKGLRFFQDNVKELRYSHHDCYIGVCPQCGQRELRVFISGAWAYSPVEVRCGKCSFWVFGIEEFMRKTGNLDAWKEARKKGKCKVCGKPFEISPYARRPREHCGSTCRKRAQRARERCPRISLRSGQR